MKFISPKSEMHHPSCGAAITPKHSKMRNTYEKEKQLQINY